MPEPDGPAAGDPPLYLTDVTYVDGDPPCIRKGHLSVERGPGGSVAFSNRPPPGAEVLDASGLLALPAFAIGHHHIYSTLARGMPPPSTSPTSFVEVLERIWWRLDRALDLDIVRASARAFAVDALRHGCAFVVDHHSSPLAAEGSLAVIAEELEALGVGHLLCLELSDRDGPDCLRRGVEETERHLARAPGLVGLHASFTVGEELLERAVDMARRFDTGIHIHVAEAESDQEHCASAYGCRVVERLERAGALSLRGTLLAHSIHLSPREREILAGSPAWIAHCPESNQNNGVGRFDPEGLERRVLVGTDGMHSDALRSLRAAYLECQADRSLAPGDMWTRLRRIRGYLALHARASFGDNDLVLLRDRSPTPVESGNVPGHLVYGWTGADVHTVIRQGRVLLRDGRVVTADEERILAEAREQARRLWRRMAEQP